LLTSLLLFYVKRTDSNPSNNVTHWSLLIMYFCYRCLSPMYSFSCIVNKRLVLKVKTCFIFCTKWWKSPRSIE